MASEWFQHCVILKISTDLHVMSGSIFEASLLSNQIQPVQGDALRVSFMISATFIL